MARTVLAALLLVLATTAAWAQAGVTNIDTLQLEALLKRGVPVIDVRTPQEWRETGTIKGAQRITAFDERGRPAPDFAAKLSQVAGPGDEVALICRTGNRTRVLSQSLAQSLGYNRLYNAEKGMKGWLAEGRPIER